MKNNKTVGRALNAGRVIGAYRLATLIAFACAVVAPTVDGAVIINAEEIGGDVVLTGSGSVNLAAWTFSQTLDDFARMDPSNPTLVIGPTPAVPADRYIDPQNGGKSSLRDEERVVEAK